MNISIIFVLGAGAIGSVVGGFLSKKNNVKIVGSKTHVQAVKSKGLSITGDVDEIIQLKADTRIRAIPKKALIILTTKAYDSAKAIKMIKNLLRKDTIILILQNGLGNEEAVREVIGNKNEILRMVTTMAAEFFEPGKVRFWNGETLIEHTEDGEEIAEIFNRCRLKTRLTKDISREIWIKLTVNCVVNPLSALFHVRNPELASDSLRSIRHGIMKECFEVAKAEGMPPIEDQQGTVNRRVFSKPNFSSMCQDIVKGKRTEIDFLNGKIVELGKKHHISTPINETLTSLIRFLEEKNELSRKH